MISSENPLLAGQAVTFESFDVAALSERLIRSLLMPQLKGEAIGERIVRYRPKLTAIRGLTEDHLKVFGKFAAAHLS
jgi:repressor of nif and glnA expression